jgi:dipeptidyl aminopeptidase/acylaminoacyl peptidase
MRQIVLVLLSLTLYLPAISQKKPLDHSVYDGWQSIGERLISNDGKWIVYTIDVQQGDNEMVIQSADANYKKSVARGYNAIITEDSRFVIFKIKPLYKDTRDARIKKKRPDDMPKDSLAMIELGKENIWKLPAVKSFKVPEKEAGWMAYQVEKIAEKKDAEKTRKAEAGTDKKMMDSLNRVIDSLKNVIQTMPRKKKGKDGVEGEVEEGEDFAEGDESPLGSADAGTDLVLRNLSNGQEKTFTNVLEYYFSKKGGRLLIEQARNPKDSLSRARVVLVDLSSGLARTLSINGNDFKNFSFSEDGAQVAYLAERNAKPKDLQKFYRLCYYRDGLDSAILLVDKNTVGMKLGSTVSEFGNVSFSKSGKRLFFGTAPIQPPRDTTIIDIDMPRLDIWHYNDDYLQTVQNYPARLRAAQQENFLAMYDLGSGKMKQLGSRQISQVLVTNEGDGETFVGVSDFGKRVETQWLGAGKRDLYAIDLATSEAKLLAGNLQGQVFPSPSGKYIVWYDRKARNYYSWDGKSARNISDKIKVALWNEDSQVPDEPGPYGVAGWLEGDSVILVYDRYDVWALDPSGIRRPYILPPFPGRKNKWARRYIRMDPEERYITSKSFYFRVFNEQTKDAAIWYNSGYFDNALSAKPSFSNYSYGNILKAKNSNSFIYTKENFTHSPNLYYSSTIGDKGLQLSNINRQQSNYNWGTAELFKWKAYNGKEATGIVYKPENFDPKKKYPMIVYFYEKLSQDLNDYKEPAPIRSAINVPFFVSRGYIIFMPDIHYTIGHPGKNAYDYIVSGARAIVKKGWVDSTKMGLQGHSWGGYQAAQVATMTKLFKAIWAGAPVANMTSAYGGIRWESGVSRQFQYEKTQSRIGATLWEKPQLYIENSPLFRLDKVTAPMVIMANDADGAVPWYQGIELFTGLRRLGKKVWMFNYNGQGHGLTQRQDMRDYQVRMQQFFDWILKGEKPAKWITEGVPAVKKGKEWGLEVVD